MATLPKGRPSTGGQIVHRISRPRMPQKRPSGSSGMAAACTHSTWGMGRRANDSGRTLDGNRHHSGDPHLPCRMRSRVQEAEHRGNRARHGFGPRPSGPDVQLGAPLHAAVRREADHGNPAASDGRCVGSAAIRMVVRCDVLERVASKEPQSPRVANIELSRWHYAICLQYESSIGAGTVIAKRKSCAVYNGGQSLNSPRR